MSLHEILHVEHPKILQFAADYKVQLIAPCHLSDAELNKFQSNLKEVLSFIKYEKDKETIRKLMQSKAFASLDREAVDVIAACTRLKLNLEEHENEGGINMCQAIEEMIEDGRAEGRMDERKAIAAKLLKEAAFSPAKVAELTGLSENEVEQLQLTVA